MKLASTLLSLLMISSFASAAVTSAKVAELSAHRIDRLVALGKIDNSFLTKVAMMQVTVVNQAPVAYRVRVSQTKPAQGNPLQLDISFDKDGKPLDFQAVAGGVAGPNQAWPNTDAVTLSENCLHVVLDNSADTRFAPFYNGLTSFVLTKTTLNGQTVAQGQIKSSQIAQKLNVYLKLDGTLISTEVVP